MGGTAVELFTDRVTAGLERALDGLAQRQRVTSANIANAATPGYRAQRVLFEDDLAAAMRAPGDPRAASISTVDAGTPARADGNSVQLDAEVAELQREGLAYQAVAQAVSFKLSLWRTAVEGR
jgi:flagellar basal-body rod protein FlgB